MKYPGIISDLDGTLALMHDREPFEWNKVSRDLPNPPVIDLLRRYDGVYSILIVTGRSRVCEAATRDWLHLHHVPYDHLYMPRGENDFRKDTEVKLEVWERNIRDIYAVQFCLDDRTQSVNFWRSLDLPCFQVAPGDF